MSQVRKGAFCADQGHGHCNGILAHGRIRRAE